jgi:putative transposase
VLDSAKSAGSNRHGQPERITWKTVLTISRNGWNRFGPLFAAEIRKKRVAQMRGFARWRSHLDEVFVKVNCKLCYLWRAVDHEAEVLETVFTAKRDQAAAVKFLKRIMKKYGRPKSIVTDGLCSYSAAIREQKPSSPSCAAL